MLAKKAFLFGLKNRRATTVLLFKVSRAPITGPWTLKAVVTPN